MAALAKALPSYAWLTALPQLISRICHVNPEVNTVTNHIITHVAEAYPQQVSLRDCCIAWLLLVDKSSMLWLDSNLLYMHACVVISLLHIIKDTGPKTVTQTWFWWRWQSVCWTMLNCREVETLATEPQLQQQQNLHGLKLLTGRHNATGCQAYTIIMTTLHIGIKLQTSICLESCNVLMQVSCQNLM